MAETCVITKKRIYLSRDQANVHCFDGMEPYICSHYRHWHIGHSSMNRWRRVAAAVRAGDVHGQHEEATNDG